MVTSKKQCLHLKFRESHRRGDRHVLRARGTVSCSKIVSPSNIRSKATPKKILTNKTH